MLSNAGDDQNENSGNYMTSTTNRNAIKMFGAPGTARHGGGSMGNRYIRGFNHSF